MGVVYKARQAKLNRLVALKMIKSGQLADEVEVERFLFRSEGGGQAGTIPVSFPSMKSVSRTASTSSRWRSSKA